MQSLWMLCATFLFAIMGVCVKLASDLYLTSEIVMFRGLIGVLFMLALVRIRGGTLRTRFAREHLWRGTVGVVALWCWFYSFSTLPLALAVTLNYTSPIWLAMILFAIGWQRGKSHLEWGFAVAIATSFGGVALLLQPSVHANQWVGSLFALGSGMLSALAYLQVRRLGLMGEPEYRVVFYFSLIGLCAGLFGTLIITGSPATLLHPHSGRGIALLLGLGISATIAQVAMTRAYRLGNALVTANLQYSGIVFSSLWGILLWGDMLGLNSWLGIAVILISGISATYYNARNARNAALIAVTETVTNGPKTSNETINPRSA
ncbi:MAG: DMT family transporter [Glaciimonas sp.]|nr:DMT family transporter [Glaciimonas sp.]